MRNVVVTSMGALVVLGGAQVWAEEHHDAHENHVAMFGGAHSLLMSEHTTQSIGVDYERRLTAANGALGVGGLVDAAIGDEVETLICPFVSVRPAGGLVLVGAIGVAVVNAGDASHLALRGGASYIVHAGELSLGPTINLDYVEEAALVYGLSVGSGF